MLLKCLKIDNNGLKSFPDLGHLSKLTHLFANQNRLSDYHDLDKLKNVLALKELELTLNPVSRRVGYRNYMIRNVMQLIYLDGKVILTASILITTLMQLIQLMLSSDGHSMSQHGMFFD